MKVPAQTVDALKANSQYFAAGAVAYALGHPCSYGCHFGMRSSRDEAIHQFTSGWEAAKRSK